jgi:hypothetical protein
MAADAVALVAGQAEPDTELGRLPTYLSAIVQGTAGTVLVYDGIDATGKLVLASAGVGTVSLSAAVACHKGVFVVLNGGATGSLLTEG